MAKSGQSPFLIEVMVRIHFLQLWSNYSDPAMEEGLYDMPVYHWFDGLDFSLAKFILAEVNETLQSKGLSLRSGTAIDATLIASPSSTKNKGGACDPEMHQTKKEI